MLSLRCNKPLLCFYNDDNDTLTCIRPSIRGREEEEERKRGRRRSKEEVFVGISVRASSKNRRYCNRKHARANVRGGVFRISRRATFRRRPLLGMDHLWVLFV